MEQIGRSKLTHPTEIKSDALIMGGIVAAISAAMEAAKLGINVIVVDKARVTCVVGVSPSWIMGAVSHGRFALPATDSVLSAATCVGTRPFVFNYPAE